ncbi:zinc-binding dehydrogenase [Nocardioides sp. CER19]|uniref:zinc-binding dehydrogenase n=1 Tax=Nocardioides sp. CER19 TaxID=3038538 RepID=UPI002446CB67|nr:zinc-binding dehydrogenase [Nocardioides sp. CER19]MDH2416214.1 zinc-binding dehydrogenase [Nocardioides sp. CER19]
MRAIVHESFGEPSEVLTVQEVPTPEPGPREVRVRTLASPIHNHDLWTVRGSYGYKPELPARAGTEAVGVVDAMGAEVTGLQVGQRVVTGGTFGVWADYFVAKAAALMPVPEGLPDDTAAQLVAMPFSAISLLDTLDLQPGDWLAQNAANGAVGRLVAQLARARGVNVLGLVRRAAGVDELRALGIDDVVATDSDDWRDRVTQITGGAPVRVGIDSVGGSATGDLVSVLAEQGTLVVFGAMASSTMQIPSGDVIFKDVTVKGFWGSRVSAAMDADKRAALMAELYQRITSGSLTLPVEESYSFEQVADAARANFAPGRSGKILLHP